MKKGYLIVAAAIVFFVVVSLYQTFLYQVKMPEGFEYPFVHNYEQDYYWYLSLMRQGYDGSLLLTSNYTPETFTPQLINTFFPLAGMAAKIFHLSIPAMYTVLRIVGGSMLLFTGYVLAVELRFTLHQRIIALLFMCFGAPFWWSKGGALYQAGEFWTGFDPILRVSWLPHHTFSNAFMIAAMILFMRMVERRKETLQSFRLTIGATCCALVSVWLNPASLMALSVAIATGIVLTFYRFLRLYKFKFGEIEIFYLILIAQVFFMMKIQGSTFPWTAFRDWERFVQYPINMMGYLETLGIVGVIAIVSIPFLLYRRDFRWNTILGWFLFPFLGLGLFTQFIPVSNGRYLQSAGYIPSALLATLAITVFVKPFSMRRTWMYIVVLASVALGMPTFAISLSRQDMYVEKNMTNPLVMVPDDMMTVIEFLSVQNPGVVAAPETLSTLLPAFTPHRTLAGHPTFTYMPEEKTSALNELIYGTDDFVKDSIIRIYSIRYIVSPEQISVSGFREMIRNSSYIVYERID